MIPAAEHAALRQRLRPAMLRRLHPILHRLIPAEALAAGVDEFHQSVLDRAADVEGATRWKVGSPALPATVDDLMARMVDFGRGTALLELRFRGLDPDFPFVEVVGSDVDLRAEDVPALIAAAQASWPQVPLRCLGLWVSPHTGWRPPGEGDMHLVVGARADIAPPDTPLTLAPATAESLPLVQAAYRAALEARPDLAPHLSPIDADDLGALIDGGSALDAWEDGAWVGLIAAEPARLLGSEGWLIVEEILAPAFRGRGLGAHFQRAGVARLPARNAPLVWGTIHSDNQPSLRCAARVGRQSVDLRWLVPIS